MKRYPLVVITISFICGILLDGMLDLPFRPLFTILIGLLVILLLIISLFINCRYRNLKNIVCIAVIILTGSAYHHYRFYSYPANNIINFISDEKSLARLQGVIISPPYKKAGFNPRSFNSTHKNRIGSKKTIFLLRVNNILLNDKWQPITGNVRVSVYPEDLYAVPEKDEHTNEHEEFTFLPLKYGDEVEIVGKIFNPKPPTNPGQFDYEKYLARHEPPVRGLMSVASMHNLKLLSRDHGNPVFRFVYSLKDKLRDTINTFAPYNEPSIISSLLLGDRETIPSHIMDDFMKTGTIPFLAISGLHVGILVVVIHFMFTVLAVNRKLSGSIIIALVILYAILTGLKPPVLRAGIMVIVYYGAIILNRRWNTPCGIAAAAMLILIRNPSELFSVSFQLSFLALIGIISLSRPIGTFLVRPPGLEERLANNWRWKISRLFKTYCSTTISVSAAAWLSVAPLVAYYFHIAAPISIPLNIIIFPLVWVILVSGFIFLILGNLFLPLAVPFAWIAFKSDYLMVKIISFFAIDHISFFYTGGLSIVWIVIYYAMGIIIVIIAKRLALKAAHLIIIALIICGIYVCSGLFSLRNDQLKLTCLNVGHGSAMFFEFPNGKNILFDVGTSSHYDVGRNVMAPFLWKSGIKKIDVVVISHKDSDHWNGLPSIFERFDIGVILTNERFSKSEIGIKLLEMARMNGIKTALIGAGDEIAGFGDAKITVLNPPVLNPQKNNSIISRLPVNDTSCVLKIDCFGYSILSCADIEEDGIRMILMNPDQDLLSDIVSDIIIVPHHGGYSKNTKQLINRVKPKYAIVSAKKGNPSKETIKAYTRSSKVFRTGQIGAITTIIDKDGIRISGFSER